MDTWEQTSFISLSGTKALFLSCVDPHLATIPTRLPWLQKNLKTLQNYLCLTHQPFHKSTPPSPHLLILILPLNILVHYDRGITIYICVTQFSSIVSRQSREMQFGAVKLEARSNTQLHTSLWTSQVLSAFHFSLTHYTKLFFFLTASVYRHSSSLVRWQIEEICLLLWDCLRSKHPSLISISFVTKTVQ